jgi:hypothetical protein
VANSPADWWQVKVMAACSCGWRGDWRDMLRDVYADQDQHRKDMCARKTSEVARG